jgi:hypothetical protein
MAVFVFCIGDPQLSFMLNNLVYVSPLLRRTSVFRILPLEVEPLHDGFLMLAHLRLHGAFVQMIVA